jgi:molybdenum cofactor guanylyltransferase
MNTDIAGAILAGGASKRFNGAIKAKTVIGGKSIISRIIEVFDSVFDEIIIVTNTPDEFVEYKNNKIVTDKFRGKGPLCGIHSALKETDKDALFIIAGDMPFPDKNLIKRQIEFFRLNRCDILVPVLNSYYEPLHGIYSKSILGLLEEYLISGKDYSIKSFLKICDVRYFDLEQQENKAFTNINTPSDAEMLNKDPESYN